MQEYSSHMVRWSGGCAFLAIIILILGVACVIGWIKDTKVGTKWKCVLSILTIVLSLFTSACFFPNQIEEHTNVVTILPRKEGFFERNKVYFKDENDIYWLPINDGQLDMYEMLENKEVILTYGKLHFLCGHQFDDNEYRFSDIKLVENN